MKNDNVRKCYTALLRVRALNSIANWLVEENDQNLNGL